MKHIAGAGNLASLGGTPHAVTIGTFDGVHLGHRALIARTIAEAERLGIDAAVVTWDRHPAQTIRPEATPSLLTSQERKVELLGETGAAVLVVLPFDRDFSQWPPERFIAEVLVEGLHSRAVLVGDGWRFGHKAGGDVALLSAEGEKHGFTATGIDLAAEGAEVVSSTRIRKQVAEGDVAGAARLLGRPHDLDGVVVRGDGRGKGLGFPTANLDIDPALARPALGIYACRADVGETSYAAAVSVGVNPTFGGTEGSPVRIEAYILDLDADLYGERVRLAFIERLRGELAFDSVDDLVVQMGKDVEEVRRLTS